MDKTLESTPQGLRFDKLRPRNHYPPWPKTPTKRKNGRTSSEFHTGWCATGWRGCAVLIVREPLQLNAQKQSRVDHCAVAKPTATITCARRPNNSRRWRNPRNGGSTFPWCAIVPSRPHVPTRRICIASLLILRVTRTRTVLQTAVIAHKLRKDRIMTPLAIERFNTESKGKCVQLRRFGWNKE